MHLCFSNLPPGTLQPLFHFKAIHGVPRLAVCGTFIRLFVSGLYVKFLAILNGLDQKGARRFDPLSEGLGNARLIPYLDIFTDLAVFKRNLKILYHILGSYGIALFKHGDKVGIFIVNQHCLGFRKNGFYLLGEKLYNLVSRLSSVLLVYIPSFEGIYQNTPG